MPPMARGRKPYVKRHGANTRADWLRIGLFTAVVAEVEGLATAAPLHKDEAAGTICFERLPPVQPLWQQPRVPYTFERFGRLLARLHASAVPPGADDAPRTRYPLSAFDLTPPDIELLEARLPSGFFWGDCWHGNVFVHADGRFFVIDPLPHRWLFDTSHLLANGALDLAMLYMSLFYSHPLLRLWRIDVETILPLGDALLRGYLQESKAMVALPAVRRLSRQLAMRYIAAYRRRLLRPIAVSKQKLSARIMSRMATATDEVT